MFILLALIASVSTTRLVAQTLDIYNNIGCNIVVTLYGHDSYWNTCAIDYQSTPAIAPSGSYSLTNVEDWNYPGVGGVYWAPGYDIFSYLSGSWDYAEVQIQGGSMLTIGNPACGALVSMASGTDCIPLTAYADWLTTMTGIVINVHN